MRYYFSQQVQRARETPNLNQQVIQANCCLEKKAALKETREICTMVGRPGLTSVAQSTAATYTNAPSVGAALNSLPTFAYCGCKQEQLRQS
jgi:hypothetical protein